MDANLSKMIEHAKTIYRSLSPRQQEEWNRRAAFNWVVGEIKLRHKLNESAARLIAEHAADQVYGVSL